MASRKLSQDRVNALLAEYDATDFSDPSSPRPEDLARKYGISKATLYNLRDNRNRRQNANNGPRAERSDLEAVVRFLTEELVKTKMELEQLRRQTQSS